VALVTCLGLAGAACASDSNDAVSATTAASASATTAAAGAATTAATATTVEGADIVATALTNRVFTELAGLVLEADLIPTLRGGPFTVFAPTDDAFKKIPSDVLHAIQASPDMLKTVLTYHVVEGALKIADLKPGPLKTVAGIDLTVTKDGDKTYINGDEIASGDIVATNGVVHVMSDVLVPPLGDIVTVATTLPGFSTLVSLVKQADLVATLQGDGPFTVFAPIDSAFEALPAATLAAVQADPALLKKVLTYHVVAGKLSTADMKDGDKLTTVAGVDLTVTKKDGATLIDGHPIAVQNVEATNGIVQVMGDVLVPAS